MDATRSVLDTEPPIIQLVGSADIKLFQGEFYEDPGVTVSDNLDTNVGITVSGEVLNQISSDYIITYDATDQAGNAANQVTRKVRVRPLSLNYSKFYGANGSVENIVAVPDNSGDYYVSGNFTIYNSLVANGIVRVNNDGTVDTTFNTGDGFNGQVRSLKVSANNDIYAVGDNAAMLHYDGNQWSPIQSPKEEYLTKVKGLGPDQVYAVGENGTVLKYDGKEWSDMSI